MRQKNKKRGLDVILRGGKPAAVIIDIEEYQEILERLEDIEDLTTLERMRQRPLKFGSLEDFLKEYSPSRGLQVISATGEVVSSNLPAPTVK